MDSTGSGVSVDEEEKDEDEELAHDDDEEDEDEINHTHLPKEVVHAPSPNRRVQKSPVWKHIQRIVKYNVSDREIQADCSHICVCPLSDEEEGSKCYCNTPLKLFRDTKSVSSVWNTSTVVVHFKKQHPRSNVARNQKGKLETRQARLGECMHASDSQSIQGHSSQKSPYGLSDNEKVMNTVSLWGTYANMKVSQTAFADPLFVTMLQAARGPYETKDIVSKLTTKTFKGFMNVEF